MTVFKVDVASGNKFWHLEQDPGLESICEANSVSSDYFGVKRTVKEFVCGRRVMFVDWSDGCGRSGCQVLLRVVLFYTNVRNGVRVFIGNLFD